MIEFVQPRRRSAYFRGAYSLDKEALNRLVEAATPWLQETGELRRIVIVTVELRDRTQAVCDNLENLPALHIAHRQIKSAELTCKLVEPGRLFGEQSVSYEFEATGRAIISVSGDNAQLALNAVTGAFKTTEQWYSTYYNDIGLLAKSASTTMATMGLVWAALDFFTRRPGWLPIGSISLFVVVAVQGFQHFAPQLAFNFGTAGVDLAKQQQMRIGFYIVIVAIGAALVAISTIAANVSTVVTNTASAKSASSSS